MMRVKRETGESSLRKGGADTQDAGIHPSTNEGRTDADFTDRRLLRSRYRALKADVNEVKSQLAQVDSGKFRELFFKPAEELHRFVSKPREQIADAELYLEISSELLDVAKSSRRKVGLSPAEFVGAIIHSFGISSADNEGSLPKIDWKALGMEACAVLHEAPGVSTMIGPMDIEIKQRRAPVSRKRERPTVKTKPQEVEEVDPDRPNSETDANVATMVAILNERQQIEVDRLLLNRVSFAQTIENLFALSFLVKDGHATFTFSQDGKQFVVPRKAPSQGERADGEGVNTQFVFRLDFADWRLMQNAVREGTEVMPHRGNPIPRTSRTPIRKNSRNRARETPSGAPEVEDDSGEESSESGKRRRY